VLAQYIVTYRISRISVVSCRIVIAIILHRTKRYSAPLYSRFALIAADDWQLAFHEWSSRLHSVRWR